MVRPSLTHKTKEGMIMIPTNNDSFGASYCRSEHKIENGQGKLPDYVRVSVVRGYVYTTVGCDLLKESFNVLGEQVQNGLIHNKLNYLIVDQTNTADKTKVSVNNELIIIKVIHYYNGIN